MAAVSPLQFDPLYVMTESVKDSLLAAFRQLLRPLIRILLRHGVSYGEYAETVKTVFVEVAGKDFRIPGQAFRS
jgi:hypothetical protein